MSGLLAWPAVMAESPQGPQEGQPGALLCGGRSATSAGEMTARLRRIAGTGRLAGRAVVLDLAPLAQSQNLSWQRMARVADDPAVGDESGVGVVCVACLGPGFQPSAHAWLSGQD